MSEITQFKATGRRKEAVARVRLIPGSGSIRVNGRPYEKYFIRETDRIIVTQPLTLTENAGKFDVFATIRGGGLTGQAGALRHGISRALLLATTGVKETLKKHKFLTRDPRMKERKKYGLKGARKRFQWTKR